jgi:hypothetical protein
MPKMLNKKNLFRIGFGLSLLVNVVVLVVVVITIVDVHTGKIDYLTDGSLQVDTCNNYFSKTNIKSGKSNQVGNVEFTPTYFTPAEGKNYCNSLNNNIEFQYLIQSNNPNALSYYNKTTNFASPSPTQYQIAVPYSALTHRPISPQSMGLSL